MIIRVDFDSKVQQFAGGGASGMDVTTANDTLTIHAALIQMARAYPKLYLFNCDGELRGALKIKRADGADGSTPLSVRDNLASGDRLLLVVG